MPTVKYYHYTFYNYRYTIGKKLECVRELESQHSEHIMSVHSKKNNERTKINRHIPYPLAKVVDRLMSEWKDFQAVHKTDVKNMVPVEGTRVPGGVIEIPCI